MKKFLALLLALALCLSFAACGGKATDDGASTDNGGDVKEPAAEATVLKIGMIYTSNGYFWDGVGVGGQDKADEINASQDEYFIEFTGQGPAEVGAANQLALFENMMSQGFDGIGIACADVEMCTTAIDRAIEGGCEMITFDTDAPESGRFAFVGSDNYEFGYILGSELCRLVSEAGGGGIIIENGVPTQLGMIQRVAGVQDAVAEYDDVEVAALNAHQGGAQEGLNNLENAISANPDFMGACWLDAGGEQLVNVWKGRGWTKEDKIAVISDDLNPVIQAVKDGVINGTCVQGQYNWGYVGVELLFNAITKGEYPEETFVNTGCHIVDSTNVMEEYPHDTNESDV